MSKNHLEFSVVDLEQENGFATWSDKMLAPLNTLLMAMDLDVIENPAKANFTYVLTISVGGQKFSSQCIVSDQYIKSSQNIKNKPLVPEKAGLVVCSKSLSRDTYMLMDKAYIRPDQIQEMLLRFTAPSAELHCVISPSFHNDSSTSLAADSNSLPGVNNLVICPGCLKPEEAPLRSVIMHLNDSHKWTRDRIADWLDKLYEDGMTDLAFPDPV